MIRCLGLAIEDDIGYPRWDFKPDLFDYERARGYLESGKLHPSDLIKDSRKLEGRTSVFEAVSTAQKPQLFHVSKIPQKIINLIYLYLFFLTWILNNIDV